MTSVSDMVSEHTHITYITTCNQRAAFETARSDQTPRGVCACARWMCASAAAGERVPYGGWRLDDGV